MLPLCRSNLSRLTTYQGRNNNSTNECAVIAPKIVADHLESSENISNEHIRQLIESKCPPLLSAIRAKHEQIEGNGFLNPADVHSYLFDNMILSKSMFWGVCRGNVLNDNHINSLSAIAQSYQHEDWCSFASFWKNMLCFYKAARRWRRLRLRFDQDIASKQRQGNANNVSWYWCISSCTENVCVWTIPGQRCCGTLQTIWRERERESQSLTRPCTRCVCKRCIEKHCMLFMLILFFCWIVSGLCLRIRGQSWWQQRLGHFRQRQQGNYNRMDCYTKETLNKTRCPCFTRQDCQFHRD